MDIIVKGSLNHKGLTFTHDQKVLDTDSGLDLDFG